MKESRDFFARQLVHLREMRKTLLIVPLDNDERRQRHETSHDNVTSIQKDLKGHSKRKSVELCETIHDGQTSLVFANDKY